MTLTLSSFDSFVHVEGDLSHRVYGIGSSREPAIILMHELPGLTQPVINLAERLVAREFRVYVPWLFGPLMRRRPLCNWRALCVSREFANLKGNVSAPVADWLRSLARRISSMHQGRPGGAIGMCLTGGYALSLVLEPCVRAAVASQPAIPLKIFYVCTGFGSGSWTRELSVSTTELDLARQRLTDGRSHLLALRFRADRICPGARIDFLRQTFPSGLETHEIGVDNWRQRNITRPHAVLTEEYDKAQYASSDHPTRFALDRVVSFLSQHLRGV